MAGAPHQDQDKTSPDPSTKPRERRGVQALLMLALVLAAGAVLYVMTPSGGKKADPEQIALAGACAASGKAAATVRPFAKGHVAAMNIGKTPRPATAIAFDAQDGKRVQLSDFAGKVILINLWATWCAPCRAEMPALDRLQAKLGGDKFEVVAINIDTARLERRKPFLDSVGVKSLAFYTDEKADIFQVLKQAGKVVGLPTTILVDAKGCELGLMAGPAEWDSPDAIALIQAAIASQ